jgi:hypothetical protein
VRLRTYIANDDGKVLPGVAYHPATQGDDYLVRSLEHDTLAAHALLQAMGELEPLHRGWNQQIRGRAAEILAGWLGEDGK